MSKVVDEFNTEVQSSLKVSGSGIGTGPRICAFCKKEYGKYSCPRCEQLYCSLSCYKCNEHKACFSTFYRDSAQAAAAAAVNLVDEPKLSGGDKIRLLELVNEYELDAQERPLGDYEELFKELDASEECDSDDKQEDQADQEVQNGEEESDTGSFGEEADARRQDLERRMQGLDIDSAGFGDLWNRLTDAEQADFVKLAREHEMHADEAL
ncbi:hypothetical protein V1512DRAFT_256115 [Lipomyces arxii]|uniref:uncharacterized protein n=1 Tax=Lipomyces arxii TaxID=56418 RepID=UPI0034CFB24C